MAERYRIYTERSREKNMVKQIIANGIEIGYQDRGQGEPLVLVMGLGASSLK